MDPYLELLVLVAALFFLPRALQRIRIPAPLSELSLGLALGPSGFALIEPSEVLDVLSGFGITALFLFAGLEVDLLELRERRRILAVHLLMQAGLVLAAAGAGIALGLEPPIAALVGAAVMSPSVGYIVSVLESAPTRPDLAVWVKQKAIAGELLAVAMVLVFANARTLTDLSIGLGAIAGLVVLVPLLILAFHRLILPWAPRTEFAFLLIVALLAAHMSHHVGVHYLAGAFLVGFIARLYLDRIQSGEIEVASLSEALTAFRFFSAFFVPFFFFLIGVRLTPEALTRKAALFACLLFVVAVPLRIALTMLHRRVGLAERWREALSVGLLLIPTTVFALAVAELLREQFGVAPWVYGGLVMYGAATGLVPLASPGRVTESGSEIVDVAAEEVLAARRRRT
jgi:Kef-type K+ transport system membrane component KefB